MSKKVDKSIEDTGERMVPAYSKGKLVYGEHIVRYEAVKDIVKGKVVLDIASGSGYGTAIIANYAKKAIGVDLESEAIKYAKKNYPAKNIEFLQGDGTKIPLDDKSVDVVVSCETLEHIEAYDTFMKEIKRVLKPDGLLVLSTPNDIEFPEGAHYHVHEFEHAEFKKLVKKYFKNSKPYYQATWIYNALLDEKELNTEWEKDVKTLNAAPVKLDKVLYFYFLCSNRAIKEKLEPIGAISEHWSTRGMLEHNAKMDKYIKDTIKHYEKIFKAKDKELAGLRQELADKGASKLTRGAKKVARRLKPKKK